MLQHIHRYKGTSTLIDGKGGGALFLLYGMPGTGKTLTVEGELAKVTEAAGKPSAPGAQTAVDFCTQCSVALANARCFDPALWDKSYLVLKGWVDDSTAAAAGKAMLEQCESAVEPEPEIDEDEDVEDLCNCNFSLAYGSKILLNNTKMRLKRGFKYGLMGPNQCGKTTLLKAISKDQVDGFPPSDEVRTIFMETDIQVDDADFSVLEFVRKDERLADVDIEEMKKVLQSVGFVQDMKDYTGEGAHQNQAVGTLSGGWRMMSRCPVLCSCAPTLCCSTSRPTTSTSRTSPGSRSTSSR